MTTLCIQAKDKDLTFLNVIGNKMAKLLGSRFTDIKLTDSASNAKARNLITMGTHEFLILLAHGSGDYLCGGQYRNWDGEVVDADKFIIRSNLSIFKGKMVFCMSCNSNGLAKHSLDEGAVAFVGFDQIPFSRNSFNGSPVGNDVLAKHCKELISTAIKAGLEQFISGKLTLDQTIPYIRLWIAKTAIAYVRKYRSVPNRREVAALFLRVGEGIRYHGPLGISYKS